MNSLERFVGVMDYKAVDQVPNWEAGAWPQTRRRWAAEGLDVERLRWNWFAGEDALGMDRREFTPFNGQMIPPFRQEVLEEDEKYQIVRDAKGRLRRALKEGSVGGARMCMDQYLRFAVETFEDWREIKKRFDPTDPRRYGPDGPPKHDAARGQRSCPRIFAPNCQTMGFYWVARELMGTEGLSYGWHDQPELLHDMMEFWADFLIESSRPVLEAIEIDYICLSEDMAMKTGPLLSPKTYGEFILPRLERVVAFFRSRGVRHVCVDTDGNPEPLVAMMMDAGVDALWPLERSADQDPVRLRKRFGRSLRLWGGVDKRELAKGPKAIEAHLRTLAPLIEEGGFIPTVDHTVPPDVSWPNFQYYLERKAELLRGEL
jgi:hypothetical protein